MCWNSWRKVWGSRGDFICLSLTKASFANSGCRGNAPVAPAHRPHPVKPAATGSIRRELQPGLAVAIPARFALLPPVTQLRIQFGGPFLIRIGLGYIP